MTAPKRRCFALTSFLLASAAAAAWARTSLGIGAALASRYTTPMLFLWMTLFAILGRGLLRGSMSRWLPREAMWLVLSAVLVVAAGSSLRPSNMVNIRRTSQPIKEAGYFIAAGILADTELAKLYPSPGDIVSPISFLRRKGLNLFDDKAGLAMPATALIAELAVTQSPPACALGTLENSNRVGENGWSIRGWVTDGERRSPLWALAFDASGHLLGVAPPLEPRPDVAKAIGAPDDFNGFIIPVRRPSGEPVSLAAIPGAGGQSCRLALTDHLPTGPYPVDGSDLVPLTATVSRMGVTGNPGVPRALHLAAPYTQATVIGTFGTADADTGAISVAITGESCVDIVLPVVRGPTATGETLRLRYGDDKFDAIDLKTIPAQKWTYLQIPVDRICRDGQPRQLTITLTDTGKDWGEWAALAIPGFRR